ncbi:hypothetical protein G3O00_32795 [Burkholderia sp. Ac-20384]|uniref:Uncharacterized protein n=1 Tax=Burkholderia lata (strain ATCC 17760 / DSM 23089 / LMG 22485 / NCIMB 9086 / R18194 / 383) TaxID=482957 RepID=Q39LF6_BURL3|nr:MULTISPECIES: hypothetical protein [Burkholderia]ABB06710.1 hypothetical protein Bcep18194_C7666 [Burkholderia lata]MBN3828352.1 hypothetical protein [Burkholderia sp. Ac-20384]
MQAGPGARCDASRSIAAMRTATRAAVPVLRGSAMHACNARHIAMIDFARSHQTKEITVRNIRIIGTQFDGESLILIAQESR